MNKLLAIAFWVISNGFVQAQSWIWVKQSDNDSTHISSQCDPLTLGTDSKGNIFEMGIYLGRVAFGPYWLQATGSKAELFLTKNDVNGNVKWAISSTTIGIGAIGGNAMSLATDKNGNIYILSDYFNYPIAFGNDTIKTGSNSTNVFLAKFDSNGNALWVRNSIGTDFDIAYGYGVAIDDSGNAYITGGIAGTIKFGSFTLTTGFGESTYIVKYDANGNVKWATIPATTGGNSVGYAICTDRNNFVYITGFISDTVSFGSTTLTAPSNDFYLAKYDNVGNSIWAKQGTLISTSGKDEGLTISSDDANNIYVAGDFQDSVQFGTYPLVNKIAPSPFIVKYTNSGNLIWAKGANGSTNLTRVCSISANKYGGFYLGGYFEGQVAFDSVKLVSDSTYPSFIFKFDSNGKALCGTEINNYNDDANALGADPLADDVYFTGDAIGEIDISHTVCYFGSDSIKGYQEVGFLAKWTCGNVETNTKTISSKNCITVYPNPSNGVFAFEAKSEVLRVKSIEVYNVLGEKVYSSQFSTINSHFSIDLSNQPNGIYLYRVIANSGNVLGEGKMVIQR